MSDVHSVLRLIHIPFGLTGLAVFVLPLVLPKGGRWHRRTGWVFVVCMSVASITAAGLAVSQFVRARGGATAPVSANDLIGPVFLLNVALLTFTAVHHGVRVLRQKRRTAPHDGLLDLSLPAALVILSLVSIALGVVTGSALLFTLPSIGVFVGAQYLIVLLRTPRDGMFWWYQHMSGMLGGCIAALTAALITNARHIRPVVPAPEWLFWIFPAAVGLPVMLLWQAKYRRRFAARAKAPRVDAGAIGAASPGAASDPR